MFHARCLSAHCRAPVQAGRTPFRASCLHRHRPSAVAGVRRTVRGTRRAWGTDPAARRTDGAKAHPFGWRFRAVRHPACSPCVADDRGRVTAFEAGPSGYGLRVQWSGSARSGQNTLPGGIRRLPRVTTLREPARPRGGPRGLTGEDRLRGAAAMIRHARAATHRDGPRPRSAAAPEVRHRAGRDEAHRDAPIRPVIGPVPRPECEGRTRCAFVWERVRRCPGRLPRHAGACAGPLRAAARGCIARARGNGKDATARARPAGRLTP